MATSPSTLPPLSNMLAALPGIFVGMMLILAAATYPWNRCRRRMKVPKSKTPSGTDSSEITVASEEGRHPDGVNRDAIVSLRQATAFTRHGIRGEETAGIVSSSSPANFCLCPEQDHFDNRNLTTLDTISNDVLEISNITPSRASPFYNNLNERVGVIFDHISLPPSYSPLLTVNAVETHSPTRASAVANFTSAGYNAEVSCDGTINSNGNRASSSVSPTPLPLYETLPNSPLPPSFRSSEDVS